MENHIWYMETRHHIFEKKKYEYLVSYTVYETKYSYFFFIIFHILETYMIYALHIHIFHSKIIIYLLQK